MYLPNISIRTRLPKLQPMLSCFRQMRPLLALSLVCFGDPSHIKARHIPHFPDTPALSPAAVFGPGDKLVSDSHVMNKNHVVIGTGTALIDWV